MGVYRVLFSTSVPFNLRIQALINPICTLYMTFMTLCVTHISFFYIVPECYYGNTGAILKHRLAIWYLFTSAIGHFVTCVYSDTSARRQRHNVIKMPSISQHDGANTGTCNGNSVINGETDSTRDGDDERQNGTESTSFPRQPPKIKGMKHCGICCMHVPFRTHHCLLCERCIVKRDHHCFFMGVCIGRENHIYFVFFVLVMGMGTFYGMMLIAKYLYVLYGVQFYGPQTFVTLFLDTFINVINGKLPSIRYLALFALLYISLIGSMAGFGFFSWQLIIILHGQTSFEASRGISKYSKNSYMANFRSVFNRRSLLSLLIPFWDIVTETNYCRIEEEPLTRAGRSGANKPVKPKLKRTKVKPKKS